MTIEVLKSKIHRCTVTEANLNYVGSCTIDEDLMDAANMIEHEKIQIVNANNGERLETYIIKGKRGSGVICMNGYLHEWPCCKVSNDGRYCSNYELCPVNF